MSGAYFYENISKFRCSSFEQKTKRKFNQPPNASKNKFTHNQKAFENDFNWPPNKELERPYHTQKQQKLYNAIKNSFCGCILDNISPSVGQLKTFVNVWLHFYPPRKRCIIVTHNLKFVNKITPEHYTPVLTFFGRCDIIPKEPYQFSPNGNWSLLRENYLGGSFLCLE